MERFEEFDRCLEKSGCNFSKDVPMRDLTTFRIGGNCSRLVEAESEAQISGVLSCCKQFDIPLYFLGNGSNLLVSDDGIDGCVLHLGSSFSKIDFMEDHVLCCEAGISLAKVCVFACEHELSGLEFAYGIPGSIGGAAYMNAGAYGGEMKDVIIRCDHIKRNGEQGFLTGEQLDFAYRHSAYSESDDCITKVYLKLVPGKKDEIRAKMDDYMSRRKSKQPLEYPSAGSTFKRPVGGYASALIDQCGLKGFSVGGAAISEKHAGFVINKGSATSKDVLDLVAQVRKIVKDKTGFLLEPEIKQIP